MIGAEPGVQSASLNDILRQAEIQPPGVNVNEPDLSAESHSLAVTCGGPAARRCSTRCPTFELPRLTPRVHERWRRWIDTYRDAREDICDGLGAVVEGSRYTMQRRSLVVLVALQRRHRDELR